jgi:hypothetical protein
MTSDIEWDPSLYDNVVEDLQEFHNTSVDFIDHDNPFDQYGEYRFRTVATHSRIPEEAFLMLACTLTLVISSTMSSITCISQLLAMYMILI